MGSEMEVTPEPLGATILWLLALPSTPVTGNPGLQHPSRSRSQVSVAFGRAPAGAGFGAEAGALLNRPLHIELKENPGLEKTYRVKKIIVTQRTFKYKHTYIQF